MSLWAALRELGYTPYHCLECGLDNANGAYPKWWEAVQAKYEGKGTPYKGKDFEKMLWRYDAITDIPCVLFVDELLEAYPDAKVVLQSRDPDAWASSVRDNFLYFLSGWRWYYLRLF